MKGLLAVALLLVITWAAQPIDPPEYTEDLDTFKKERPHIRMQMLAGCWLIVNDHLMLDQLSRAAIDVQTNQSNETAPAEEEASFDVTPRTVAMVKKCLQKITLKDAVAKVTSIVGKNLTLTKGFFDIVGDFVEEDYALEPSAFDKYIGAVLQVGHLRLRTTRET